MAMYFRVIACFRAMETDFWSSRITLDSFQIDEMRFVQPSCRASSRGEFSVFTESENIKECSQNVIP